jgi:hypothetical protein
VQPHLHAREGQTGGLDEFGKLVELAKGGLEAQELIFSEMFPQGVCLVPITALHLEKNVSTDAPKIHNYSM